MLIPITTLVCRSDKMEEPSQELPGLSGRFLWREDIETEGFGDIRTADNCGRLGL